MCWMELVSRFVNVVVVVADCTCLLLFLSLGFSAKRVLDVHDNDERMIILANAFEHTVQ